MLPLMEEAACAEFIIVGQLAADTRSAGTTVTFLYHGKAQLNYEGKRQCVLLTLFTPLSATRFALRKKTGHFAWHCLLYHANYTNTDAKYYQDILKTP